jgi:cobalt/nickel transport system permease protein
VFTLLAGDGMRAAGFLVKAYLSAVAVLVVTGTTPLPDVMRGLEGLRTPRFLVLVAQFVYRYLFVISEQAQHMRAAAASRGGGRWTWRAAAGALSVLFARSYARAEGIHRAMLARGFDGHTPSLARRSIGSRDVLLLAVGLCAVIVVRLACPR